MRTGAARRPPDDIGVFGRAVPRPGRPRAGAAGRGGPGSRVGADGYRPGSYRQARPRHGRGYRAGYHRHVHRPRFFYPRVYGSYFYFPGYAFDLHYGYPYYWGPRWGGYSYWPYNPAYALDYEDPYTGYLRLKVKPREAEVYVDGFYVGLVDHFDGVFQRLRLPEGAHRVEIRHPGFRHARARGAHRRPQQGDLRGAPRAAVARRRTNRQGSAPFRGADPWTPTRGPRRTASSR